MKRNDVERQEEAPPPYEVDKDASLIQDADSDAESDSDLDSNAKLDQCPPDWQTGPFNLDIICRPNNTTDWVARLQVYAKDVLHNFNAVYDDMPLGGWWPWPKKSQ
ncbi:hypothetical protein TOPH_07348 [Tolypocladium ophioglossoides CBS 100239]|uniref:Uncharacterized protein n=1 Tax=Tolypocladium ophioglossoides (strain CBS 100239) TaxID=1163406 RepID=A0A0L0N1R6_TOLOC|nr:hypothetical protein TOPH_07348 [Tolypocladium ophioglossoides CBS 100239]